MTSLPPRHPVSMGVTTASPLLQAYRGRPVTRRPVWFMRQAGRSLPEYRAARAGTTMLQACLTPPLAADITCQPVRRHGVDAAIFFSDIVVPLKIAGVEVEIVPGVGPVLAHAVRTPDAVAHLPRLEPAALERGGLAQVRDGVGLAVEQLGPTPLIGFAGAPFTLASYMVEGRPNRELPATRALMANDPATWHRLLGWVAELAAIFLRAQGEAGASALQLFDSWVGRLSPAEYEVAVLPHSAAVFAAVADLGLARVHFGTATAPLLPLMHQAGADVMGVAADTTLAGASRALGGAVPLQGNLDPALLSAGWDTLRAAALEVVASGDTAPGHVFNLGHGVPPDTDPEVLTRLVSLIHSVPPRGSGALAAASGRPTPASTTAPATPTSNHSTDN